MSKRTWITPDNEEHWLQMRHTVLTSTEVSALLNMNPYQTEFELWHNKRAEKPPVFQSNERMEWGSRLEGIIAMTAGEKLGMEEVHPLKDFCMIPEYKMGTSFDYVGEKDGERALLECKNVDSRVFDKNWVQNENGVIEAPPYIEIQVQYQMLIGQFEKAYICALVGGNTLITLPREPIKAIQKKLFKKVQEFWAKEEEPSPNFEKDAEFIAKLYSFAHPDKTIEPNARIDELVAEWHDLKRQEKEITTAIKTRKAELLTLVGDAEKVKGNKYSISAGLVGPSEVSYTRDGYRNFRITYKKDYKDE